MRAEVLELVELLAVRATQRAAASADRGAQLLTGFEQWEAEQVAAANSRDRRMSLR